MSKLTIGPTVIEDNNWSATKPIKFETSINMEQYQDILRIPNGEEEFYKIAGEQYLKCLKAGIAALDDTGKSIVINLVGNVTTKFVNKDGVPGTEFHYEEKITINE